MYQEFWSQKSRRTGYLFYHTQTKACDKKDVTGLFLCCIAQNWRFRQPIFRHGFTVLSNHFRAVFPPWCPLFLPLFGIRQGRERFFEKKQNNFCCFQKVFNFPAANFPLAAGIFCFFRQFSVSFRIFHFLPIHKIRKGGYQIQQIQFAMQKAESNTRKTITASHSAIRHFLARLHSLVTAVAAGISVALTVLTAGAAATAIASKYGHFGVKLVNKRDFGDDRYGYGMICENWR